MDMIIRSRESRDAIRFEKGKVVNADGCMFIIEDVTPNLVTMRPLAASEIEKLDIGCLNDIADPLYIGD